MRQPQAQFERDRTALKHYMIGRGFSESLAALGIAERWHVGFRKDKVTPELHHQISGCFNFHNTPIKGLTKQLEQAAYTAFLLHDVLEDYDVTVADLKKAGISDFSISLVEALTKVKGETDEEFFERLLCHWLVPILKGCDRDNNVLTMQGAFTLPKMKAYIEETRKYILPLLKKAGRIFPAHTRSYSALASGIKKQLRIYEGFIAALEENEAAQTAANNKAALLSSQNQDLAQQLVAAQTATESALRRCDQLLNINGDLQKALASKPSSNVTLDDLTISRIVDAAMALASTRVQRRTDFASELKHILAGPPPSMLAGANINAEMIPGQAVDLSNTIFKSS